MPTAQQQIDALLKELAAMTDRAEKAEKERDNFAKKLRNQQAEMGARKFAEGEVSILLGVLLERIRKLEDVPHLKKEYLVDLWTSAFNDLAEFAHWRPLVDYIFRKQSETTSKIFDSKGKNNTGVPRKAVEDAEAAKDPLKDAEEAGKNTLYDIVQQQKRADDTISSVAEATRVAAENSGDATPEAVKAMDDIFNSKVPPQAEPAAPLPTGAKKTAGRKVPKNKKKALAQRAAAAAAAANKGADASAKEFEISYVCPQCGETHWVRVNSIQYHLRAVSEIIESSLYSDLFDRDLFECKHCGFKHVHNPEDQPIPVVPMGTLGQDFVIMAGVMGAKGVPVNRFEKCVGTEQEQLGSDTLDRNIDRLYRVGGLKVLADAITAEAKKSEVILVDETPFSCMQQAGKSQVDGDAVRKELGTNAKQAQIVAVASAPGANLNFRAYYRSNSRSTDSIGLCLEGWTPDVIVADGLGVYDKLTNYDPKRRQVCMVHWRRKVLRALNVKELEDVVQSDDGFVVAQQKIVDGDPQFKMCAVVAALQKLYAWESSLKRLPDESLRAFRRRVKACRQKHAEPLMRSVDLLMKEMAEHYVKYDEVKKTYVHVIDSPLSAAIVFYMNNRQGLRLFLSDPRVPPDSNAVEQAIRPVTIIRNDSHFKQSPDFIESMCGYMTLVETARVNGITKPMHWLQALGRAFYQHCLDWTITLKARAGLNTTKPLEWSPEAVASFDVTRFLPWNWKDPV